MESGETSMVAINQSIGRMLGLGEKTDTFTFEEAISSWGPPMSYAMSSNVRVSADKARSLLGWKASGPSIFEEIEKGSYKIYK